MFSAGSIPVVCFINAMRCLFWVFHSFFDTQMILL
nr:MAG TPA: hypothetical protein [Caudoviricetes sp.]